MLAFSSRPIRTLLTVRVARFVRESFRPRRRLVARMVALTVVTTLTPFAAAVAVRGIVDRVRPGHLDRLVLPWLGALAAIGLIHAVLGVRRVDASLRLAAEVVTELQERLYDRVQRMPIPFFARVRPGAVASRLVNDLEAIETAVGNTLSTLVSAAVTLVATTVALAVVDWRLLIAGVVALVFVPAVRYRVRSVREMTDRLLLVNARTYDRAFERLGFAGAQHVKLNGTYSDELAGFVHLAEERQRLRADVRSAVQTLDPVVNGILSVLIAIGTVVALSLTELNVGSIVFFTLAVRLAQQPLASAAAVQLDLAIAAVVLDRVYEVLDFPVEIDIDVLPTGSDPDVDSSTDATDGADSLGRLVLRDVSFAFPATRHLVPPSLAIDLGADQPRETVLDRVSVHIEPGTFVGIVGATGSGKSSLAGVLTGLLRPTTGLVELDGVDLAILPRSELRRSISYVAQDCYLLNDTVKANLTFGLGRVSPQDYVRACQIAQIHSFVHRLPSGYNTVVGENGARLSGGQRQRLAMARAMLARPPVLVLDEATAHVDAATEQTIHAAIAEELAGSTRIVIAHRLSVVRAADQILFIQEGRVAECGTHSDLMALGGEYASAWAVQHC